MALVSLGPSQSSPRYNNTHQAVTACPLMNVINVRHSKCALNFEETGRSRQNLCEASRNASLMVVRTSRIIAAGFESGRLRTPRTAFTEQHNDSLVEACWLRRGGSAVNMRTGDVGRMGSIAGARDDVAYIPGECSQACDPTIPARDGYGIFRVG